jgi:2-C-methyl-D-erythritol 4-phosphate cytidylyltransferase
VTPEIQATAVIAAAGSGERLGAGGPKALVELGGRPLVAWSLAALAAAETVSAAVVAAPGDQLERFESALGGVEPALPAAVVAGGASRSESVAAALGAVQSDLVVVHDAARPLAAGELFDAVVSKLAADAGCDCVLAAAPITDTVKETDGEVVERTLDRSRLWGAQTPQAFRAARLREALDAAGSLAEATDDAMLVERIGGRVAIHPSPPQNIKVTTPLDLRVAELLLAERESLDI